ncbi:DMT family transporter [Tepidimonas charontis]|uniref:2A78: carboxylate/amino acid/amine transporter n=1 Tax=Tepidimonas charontis TaxID=2267262 RepID=A0A554XBS1_9BURK|nr:DMT family transporter [Tepidimonas charontis]TSE33236.1 2A78: carboxylate/amino acid/amine transporter [Tepidimonas charontis]
MSAAPTTTAVPSPAATRRSGLLLAAAGAVAFSGKAIIVKLAYRHGVDAVTLLMYRMLFALPLFAAMLWWVTRRAGPTAPPLRGRDWAGVLWLGLTGYYAASFLDFWGLQYISASLERLILYLNPTLVLVLGWLLYRRRLQVRQLAAMALSYGGVLLVFGHELRFDGWNTVVGAALVLASAVSYALYLAHSGQMVQRFDALRLVGWATLVACVLCLLQFALLRPLSAAWVPAPVLWLSLANAVLCTFAPVIMVMMAIERIGASLTAQIGMIGPLSTIALGVVLLGEPLNAWIAAGTAAVLAGVWWASRAAAG